MIECLGYVSIHSLEMDAWVPLGSLVVKTEALSTMVGLRTVWGPEVRLAVVVAPLPN